MIPVDKRLNARLKGALLIQSPFFIDRNQMLKYGYKLMVEKKVKIMIRILGSLFLFLFSLQACIATASSMTAENTFSVGGVHTCYVLASGKVDCWGYNQEGELGNGSTVNQKVPVTVSLITSAKQVVSGELFSCALLKDNTVKCWGSNAFGQLGNPKYGNSNKPIDVIDKNGQKLTNVKSLSASASHVCALMQQGHVQCWGKGTSGQLGNAGLLNSTLPVTVLTANNELLSGITSISTGKGFSCALLKNKTVDCWGFNNWHQLGTTAAASFSPVAIPAQNLTDVVQISAGDDGACALLADGTVKCWGLGTNIFNSSGPYLPTLINYLHDVQQISYGDNFMCDIAVLGGKRTVQCLGNNASGQLGNGLNISTPNPQTVKVLSTVKVLRISAGPAHACAVDNSGKVVCWGNNTLGQLGDDTAKNSNVPVKVVNILKTAQVSTSKLFACRLLSTGTVQCWGKNFRGQLGNGQIDNDRHAKPQNVIDLLAVSQISANGDHACALKQDGTIYCWGADNKGQLGNGKYTTTGTPQKVLGLDFNVGAKQVSAGYQHTCAVMNNGIAYCWGYELRDGESYGGYRVNRPQKVVGFKEGALVDAISAGNDYTCAKMLDGSAYCWGDNGWGQLGDGRSDLIEAKPQRVLGLSSIAQISTGKAHTCALLDDGVMNCWGSNGLAQLGLGRFGGYKDVPTAVPSFDSDAAITSVIVGGMHTCAYMSDHSGYCWGYNDFGQTLISRSLAARVVIPPTKILDFKPGVGISKISAGEGKSCLLLEDNSILCNGSGWVGSSASH